MEGKMLYSGKDLRKLIIPLIIEQILAIAVGMADTIMVSAAGEAAVSGVSLVDTVNILLINVFSALATGGAVVSGHFLGKKKREDACKSAWQILLFATLLAFVISVIFITAHDPLLRLMFGKIEDDVMKASKTYLIITTYSFVALAIYNSCAALFRAMNESKVTMWVSLLMNVINVVGNAICIYGLHMGVAGVAIPTTISRYVAAVVIFLLMFQTKKEINLCGQITWKFNGSLIKKILYIAIPNGLENSMFQLGKLLLLSMISGFGTTAIAANAVANTVAMIAVLPGMAVGYGIVSVISQCVGSGDYEQVRYYGRKLIKWVYLLMGIVDILIILLIPVIIDLYGLSEATGDLAGKIILFHNICAIVIWPISFSLPNVLRAASDVMYTMIIGVGSMWVFRILSGYLLGSVLGMGVFGVWVAMIIDWVVRSVCFLIRYHGGKWKHPAVR